MDTQIAYLSKSGDYFSQSRPEMLAFIPVGANRILEVGCGSGCFAALLKRDRDVNVTGIEPFTAAAREASARVDRLIHGDVESGLKQLAGESFDCIVFNDVLEHLVDPWKTLADAKLLLRPHGVVVASVPNVRYLPVLRDLLFYRDWKYTAEGVMDRTHLRFFTMKSIAEVFRSAGFEILKIEGINKRRSWKMTLTNFVTLNAMDDARYMQIAVVASTAP